MKDSDGVERQTCLTHIREDVEYTSPDYIFMKGMLMEKKGTTVLQHSHEYAHTSLLVKGSVEVFLHGELKGKTYTAPAFIAVPAKAKHLFQALEDDTHVYCIHNMADYSLLTNGRPLIHQEHKVEA